ncbi:MAG: hypothetical protein KJ906_01770 [Nanoarchaeota archaeon]|nr:hypothetical protein [Nanoarchaeota archaeon]
MVIIIPKSEQELANAKPGDLIKMSISETSGPKSYWTIFEGQLNGEDRFIRQDEENGMDIISYNSERKYHQFDKCMGVIINHLHHDIEYYSPLEKGIENQEYQKRVEQLKVAELWDVLKKDQSEYMAIGSYGTGSDAYGNLLDNKPVSVQKSGTGSDGFA